MGEPFINPEKTITPLSDYQHIQKNTMVLPLRSMVTHFSPELESYYRSIKGIDTLTYEIVRDIDTCRLLWQEFSPNRSIFDIWDFRYTYWLGYRYEPYFILLRDAEPLGVLPLWYNDDLKQYEWFGGLYPEDNTFFVKDPLYIPLLLSLAPPQTILTGILLPDDIWYRKYISFENDDPKYVLSLEKMRSLDDYFMSFTKKTRYNLKHDRDRILQHNPTFRINEKSDLYELIRLNNEHYHALGEDTGWEDPRRIATYEFIADLDSKKEGFETKIITLLIDGVVASVELATITKDIYTVMKCGHENKRFPGIGNYAMLLNIEDSITMGRKYVDYLQESYGYKERYFDPISLYKYASPGYQQPIDVPKIPIVPSPAL